MANPLHKPIMGVCVGFRGRAPDQRAKPPGQKPPEAEIHSFFDAQRRVKFGLWSRISRLLCH